MKYEITVRGKKLTVDSADLNGVRYQALINFTNPEGGNLEAIEANAVYAFKKIFSGNVAKDFVNANGTLNLQSHEAAGIVNAIDTIFRREQKLESKEAVVEASVAIQSSLKPLKSIIPDDAVLQQSVPVEEF